MKIFKQIFYVLFIFVTSCGYQSIETYYKGDFQITELNITGNKNINRIIDRNLKKQPKIIILLIFKNRN